MSDFGDGKWVVGHKRHRCDACMGPIPAGESHYNYRGMYGGDWQNWRMHKECFDDYVREQDEEFTMGSFEMPDRIAQMARAERKAAEGAVR